MRGNALAERSRRRSAEVVLAITLEQAVRHLTARELAVRGDRANSPGAGTVLDFRSFLDRRGPDSRTA